MTCFTPTLQYSQANSLSNTICTNLNHQSLKYPNDLTYVTHGKPNLNIRPYLNSNPRPKVVNHVPIFELGYVYETSKFPKFKSTRKTEFKLKLKTSYRT